MSQVSGRAGMVHADRAGLTLVACAIMTMVVMSGGRLRADEPSTVTPATLVPSADAPRKLIENGLTVQSVTRAVSERPVGRGPGTCPVTEKRHSVFFDENSVGLNVTAQGGFLETEWAAAQYVIPASDFPIKLGTLSILFASPTVTASSHTEWTIAVWQGPPSTGTQVFTYSSNDIDIPHLQHPVGQNVAAIIQFSVDDTSSPGDAIIVNDDGTTHSFTVGFRVDHHNAQVPYCFPGVCDVACNPNDAFCGNLCTGNNMMPATDRDGLSQAGLNWIFGSSCGGACFTGWKQFSQIQQACRPTGDWLIKCNYTSVNCVPLPIVTTVTPNSANNAGTQHLVISGQNFGATGTTAVSLTKMGQPSINATNVVVDGTATTINCDVNLAGAATGAWTVLVGTTGGNGQLTDGLTITAPQAPIVTGVSPGAASNNAILHAVVTGDNFIVGQTSAKFVLGGNQVNATNVVVNSATQLTGDFDLRCVTTGTYGCQVTTPFGNGTLGTAIFVGSEAAPIVFGSDVTDATNCPGNLTLLVFGANLQPGAQVYLKRTGQADLAATTVVFNDSTTLTATFNTASLLTGVYDLKVVQPDCQQGVSDPQNWTLTVAACVPSVSAITPATSNNHQTAVAITNLAGTNFVSGATVKLTRAGQPDIVATGVNVVSPAQITCTLNPFLVQVGQWKVVVTNPGGASSTENVFFTVTAGPAPTVSLVTPANPTNCGNYSATILGTNYLTGATVQLELAGQPNIVGTSVVRVSATQLTAVFNLTGAATTPGATKWNCRVTNPDAQQGLGTNRVNVTQCSVSCTRGDVNGDTLRDGRDIAAFTRVYLNPGAATATEQCAADLASPAGVEANDVPAFVNCLLTGACP